MPRIVKYGSVVVSDEVVSIRENHSDTQGVPDEVVVEDSAQTLAEAQAAAAELLQRASEEADRIRQEASEQAMRERISLLEQTERDAEQIRQQAYELGMSEGMRDQCAAVGRLIESLEEAVSRIEGEQAGFMAEHEANLRWLAHEIASRVLAKRIGEDDAELASLVKAAVGSVKNADWVSVELSDKASTLIEQLSQELRKTEGDRVEIRGVPAPSGTCRIETAEELIDASVYTQLSNLKEYFS